MELSYFSKSLSLYIGDKLLSGFLLREINLLQVIVKAKAKSVRPGHNLHILSVEKDKYYT